MALLPLRRGGTAVPVRRGEPTGQATEMNRVEPWNDSDYMDRVFDSFFRAPFSLLGRSLTPRHFEVADTNIELYETNDELMAYAYIPGISQDTVDISVTDDTLSIKAERKPLFEAGENTRSHTPWHTLAAGTSTFSSTFELPVPVDAAKVHATYKDGVLAIKMPKSEAAKPKQIKVEVKQG